MFTALEPITPTEGDRNLARASSETLARLIAQGDLVRLHANVSKSEEINLSAEAAHLLQEVLEQIAQGHSVVVLPVDKELTTTQAADIIGVSRPFIVQLLEQGNIPFHKAGTHRRLRLQDVLAYRQERERRHALLDALVQDAQELDMGY